MIVICEAEWVRNPIFDDQSTLEIAGLAAWVNDRGDTWEWKLAIADQDPYLGREIGSGWVDSEDKAKQEAEDAIRLFYSTKTGV